MSNEKSESEASIKHLERPFHLHNTSMSNRNHMHSDSAADIVPASPTGSLARDLEEGDIKRPEEVAPKAEDQLEALDYLDRSSIGQARISTFEQDIGITGSEFSTAVSILSYGYILGQIPSNALMLRVRPSIYLCSMAIIWSGVSAATCGVKSATGLYLVRFFLGVVEAPLFPGALMMLGCWYTRREIAFRMALLYSAQTIAFCLAGLIAAAVYETLEGKYGVAGWQWLFIVLAVCGAGFACIAFFILPDYPHSTTGSTRWSMTEEMRLIARVRMEADRVTSSHAKAGIWTGFKMSVFDVKTWFLAFLNIGLSAAYGFNNFLPSIIRGLGHSNTVSLLLTAPPYVFATIMALINCWHSDRSKERGWHFSVPILFGCAGYIVCLATDNTNARYGASFIYVCGMYMANPLISTWVATTMGRTPEKRAIALALINVLGQIGNIIAPYFFLAEEEPVYRLAFILMMVMAVFGVANALGLKLWLTRSNRKLRRRADENNSVYQPYLT